ncbi:DUF397 domain-containing protein [Spirillospora sp. NPDC048819]|uniref:DUF397 domain-containing protein n=1 Tax=Spirillospora sp. NPDC048819 TaxID=3155268 RepID=UPI0033C8CA10
MWAANVVRWRKSSHSDSSGGSCVEVCSLAPIAGCGVAGKPSERLLRGPLR